MRTSIRFRLLAALSAASMSLLAIPPATPDARHAEVPVAAPRVQLTAAVRTLTVAPPNPEHVAAATAAIDRIDPAVGQAAAARRPALRAAVSAAVVAPQNAASSAIDAAYQAAQGAITYGVQLASYALQFIPFGYLISDQINIFYYTLGLPIADSIVYGLIDPVVNDPLNPAVYVNGLLNVGQTAVNAAINTGVAEFDNFFGWLIPPLPPVARAAAATKSSAASGAEATPAGTEDPAAPASTGAGASEASGSAEASEASGSVEASEASGSVGASGSAEASAASGATTTDASPAATPPQTLEDPKTLETSELPKALKSHGPADAADATKTTKTAEPSKAVDDASSASTATKTHDSASVSHSGAKKNPGKKSREHGANKDSVNGSTDDKPAKAEASSGKN